MKSIQAEERSVVLPDGGRLSYRVAGQGLPVLLLNGLGGSWEAWAPLVAHFRDRYRFVFFDYRGLRRGQDGSGARSMGEHAFDASAVLDAEGVTRAAIVAWSMGVQVALELFRRTPSRVASLVLINGAARPAWARSANAGVTGRVLASGVSLLHRAPWLLKIGLKRGVHTPEAFAWARRLGFLGEQADAETYALLGRSLADMDAGVYLATLDRLAEHDATDVLRIVDVPTLVIAGDRDPFTSRASMEQLVSEVAGAEYLLLAGTSHFAPIDQAERVNLRIEKFWSERGYRGESLAPPPPGA